MANGNDSAFFVFTPVFTTAAGSEELAIATLFWGQHVGLVEIGPRLE